MSKTYGLLLLALTFLGCATPYYPDMEPPRPQPVVVDPVQPGPVQPTPQPQPQPTPGPVIPDPIGVPIGSSLFDAFVENVTTLAQTEPVVGKGNHPNRRERLDVRTGITYRFFLVLCPTGVKDAVLEFRGGILINKDVCF